MKISLSEQGVPFVISYRKILRKPKISRRRQFVGPMQFVKNMALKVIELLDDAAFETQTEVEDPGKSVVVHWAVNIEDPWDIAPGREATLVAFRMMGDRPPCGAHFEIISAVEDHGESAGQTSEISPEELQSEGIGEDPLRPSFVRPPDSAYAPRSVEPLVDSVIEETDDHSKDSEAASDLAGPSSFGEDD